MKMLLCKPRQTILWWMSLSDLELKHALKREHSFVVSIQKLMVRKDDKSRNVARLHKSWYLHLLPVTTYI